MAGEHSLTRARLLYRRLVKTEPLAILPFVTLLVVLLNGFEQWFTQVPLIILCAAGLIHQRLLRSTTFWCFATAIYASGILINWATCDNHKYLICYWCLALVTVFEAPKTSREAVLAFNGRVLVGLCMGMAVFWRMMSDCYHDGTFFHFTLLADPRFEGFSCWLAGASSATLSANRELRTLLVEGYQHGVEVNRVVLADVPSAHFWAGVLTWWTLLTEGLIAVLFLLPDSRKVAIVRNCLLLSFGVATYSVATVRGFGWMLMVLGLAQCTRRDRHFRVAYLAVFLLIQAYVMPYPLIIERLLALFG